MSLYGPEDYYKTQRVLIAAKYSGKTINLKDSNIPENLIVPKDTFPIYSDDSVTLFETNAIAEYVGNEELRGKENKALVAQWCNYADLVLLPAVGTLVFPCFGLMPLNKAENEKAKATVQGELEYLNKVLVTKTFFVGERLSQADITVFSVLKMLYEQLYDEATRRSLVNVNRWIVTIANQDKVKAIIGEFKLCTEPAQFDAKKYAELHPKKECKKAEKTEKKAEQKPEKKEKPKKEIEEEDDDEPLVPVEKECDPYKALPAGTFNMEDWKRVYSNNDIETIALKYFWEKLDTDNYSIWTCEYLFPEELGLIFMTCNLVSGMFQRLEKLRKYAFGSMVILGQDRNNTIKGLWVWRGQDLCFPLSPDCSVDYESYKWEKLDAKNDATKDIVKKYFLHEGDFGEKAFNQGKIFK